MSVVSALELLVGQMPADVAAGPEVATALVLAARMDDPANSATSVANCAKELRETLAVLRGLAPSQRAVSQLDDLAERRQRRRSGAQS